VRRATLVEGEKDPEIAPDVELLFERLDKPLDTVEELLAQMLQSRAHWLRPRLGDPAALRARMTASLGEIITAVLGSALEKFRRAWLRRRSAADGWGPRMRGRGSSAWKRLIDLTLTAKGAWENSRAPSPPIVRRSRVSSRA